MLTRDELAHVTLGRHGQAPRRACLEDGEDGTMVLTSEEDARLKMLIE